MKTREEQYKEVKEYLVTTFSYKDPPENEPISLNSGDNSVFMKGPFAGHSLRALKQFIAEVEGRKITYED